MTLEKGANQTFTGKLVREKILAIIRREEMTGHFLSIREIGEAVGLHSSSTVWNHVTRLRREGKITTSRLGHSRSIRYVKMVHEVCGCCNGSGFASNRFQGIMEPDIPGTELIGDKRSPEETSFGH